MSRPRRTIVIVCWLIVCWLIDCGRAELAKNELHWTSEIKKLPRPMNYVNGLITIQKNSRNFLAVI